MNSYQQQVIEKENLSLDLGQFLFVRLVGIRHLKQSTATHQTSVGHSKNLQKKKLTGWRSLLVQSKGETGARGCMTQVKEIVSNKWRA